MKGKFPLVLYDQCEVNRKEFTISSSVDKDKKNSITLYATNEDIAKEWVEAIKTKIKVITFQFSLEYYLH